MASHSSPVILFGFFFGVGYLRCFTNAAGTTPFFAPAVGFIDFGGMLAREGARR
jgi:hypothetical protein